MALMVFLAFLSMFTNQWVPVYMEESEAKHGDQVGVEFSRLRQTIDYQVLGLQIAQLSNDTIATPFSQMSTFTLGARGMPVFAADTAGILGFEPTEGLSATTFTGHQDGFPTLTHTGDESSGTLKLLMPNRYFVRQTWSYENGALILSQEDGEVIRTGPHMSIEKVGTLWNVDYAMVQLIGQTSSETSTGTQGVHTKMIWTDTTRFEDTVVGGGDLAIIITSVHLDAWEAYYRTILTDTGMIEGTDFDLTVGPGTVTLDFHGIRFYTETVSRVLVSIGREAL